MERGSFPPPTASPEPQSGRGAPGTPSATVDEPSAARGVAGEPTATTAPADERGEAGAATATATPEPQERGAMTLISGSGPSLPSSLTVAGLKQRIDKKSTAEDELLRELLEAAFAQAQGPPPYGCGRLLSQTSQVTKTFRLRWRRIVLPDASEITSVALEGVTVAGGEYHVVEADGYVVGMELSDALVKQGWSTTWGWGEGGSPGALPSGYRQGDRFVAVTAKFGFASIPPNLNEAIYLLAARMYYEKEAQFADQVAVGEGATAQIYYRQLPPRARLAFESFSLPHGIGGLA